MKVSSQGRVTIPAAMRRKLGMLPKTDVEFIASGSEIIIRKAGERSRRGKDVVAALRGRATRKKMSTDAIMALTRG